MKSSTSPQVGSCFTPALKMALPSAITLLFGCASVAPTDPGNASRSTTVPAELAVPSGNGISFHAFAAGVQIYSAAAATNSPTGFTWTLKAPEAALFDAGSNMVGSHYAGPTWASESGSRVVGARLTGVTVDSNAIPWLLLQAKSTEGPGIFERTTYIQRVNTTGGLAPAAAPTQAGQEVRVPYTAEYYFYRASLESSSPVGERTRTATGRGITVKVSRRADIWTTTNGFNWTQHASGTERLLYDVAHGNDIFVVVGNEGVLLTSSNGVTWTARDSRTDERLRGIVFGNGKFVAVGYAGTVISSPDGIRWTVRPSGAEERLQSITFAQGKFVVVGWGGIILNSEKGSRWRACNSGSSERLDGITYRDGCFLVTVTNRLALISTDGVKWRAP